MTLLNFGIVSVNPRMTRFTRDHLIWILEVMTVVHTTKGIRNDSRYSCIFSPRTTCPLLVIFSHWRNISKADGSKRTNINTNCGSTHIEELKKFVKEKQLDVGFAYDGDADRCIAVDDQGNEVNGDLIMYVCGKYMKEQGQLNNNTVVTTVMSNLGLYKALEREGIAYEQTAVGDKYVCENMMTNGHSIGGEQSGHIIFSKHATTGDGILTSLKLMEVIIEKKVPLSTLIREVKIYPQVLKNVRVHDKKEARENPKVKEAIGKAEAALGGDGRILVRESGTEPLIRVMVEAPTDQICEEYVQQIVDVMEAEHLVLD